VRSIIVFQTVAMHGRASIQSCRRGPAGREPTGQGKQIETYLCAHVAVHGQPPAGLGWLAGWLARREPGAHGWWLAHWHWRAHVLVLALGARGWSFGFRRRPSNRGRLFCLPPCSGAVSGVDIDNELCYAWSHGLERGRVPKKTSIIATLQRSDPAAQRGLAMPCIISAGVCV